MTHDEYEKKFASSKLILTKENKLFMAFEKAHDIRKFEIELYWKRTAYFWTLIAATFAGYFILLTSDSEKLAYKDIYLTIISSMGLIFSLGWFLAAKGSKFWQENWEGHIDMLENAITGPLYKTVLHDTSRKKFSITSAQAFSVSKVNQWIATLVIVIWFALMISPLGIYLIKEFAPAVNSKEAKVISNCIEVIIVIFTLFFVFFMCRLTKTQLSIKTPDGKDRVKQFEVIERKTKLK